MRYVRGAEMVVLGAGLTEGLCQVLKVSVNVCTYEHKEYVCPD